MTVTLKEAQDLRARATQAAIDVGLDDIVRTIAKTVRQDSHNFRSDFDGKRFMATDGAGTNSASVIDIASGTLIYDAADYGRVVKCFRRGRWVERADSRAKQIKANAEEEERRREACLVSDILSSFSDWIETKPPEEGSGTREGQ